MSRSGHTTICPWHTAHTRCPCTSVKALEGNANQLPSAEPGVGEPWPQGIDMTVGPHWRAANYHLSDIGSIARLCPRCASCQAIGLAEIGSRNPTRSGAATVVSNYKTRLHMAHTMGPDAARQQNSDIDVMRLMCSGRTVKWGHSAKALQTN
jgi:hypothetical protein